MIGRLALHFFFPQSCPVCGELGQDICPQCLKSALEVNPLPHCLVCGKASPCEQHGTRYTVTALCRHKGRARDILLAAKYGQRGRLAYQMGRELAALAGKGAEWTIVVIPPHKKASLSSSGDSHLEWMARGLAKAVGGRVQNILEWTAPQRPQKMKKSRQERRKLPNDCFVCAARPPQRVLLLDDVCTTGTTLWRATRALYVAGAKEVRAVCWSSAAE